MPKAHAQLIVTKCSLQGSCVPHPTLSREATEVDTACPGPPGAGSLGVGGQQSKQMTTTGVAEAGLLGGHFPAGF